MTLIYFAIAFALGILAGHGLRSEGLLGCTASPWLFPAFAAALVVLIFLLRASPKGRLAAA